MTTINITVLYYIVVEAGKLERGFRQISARIPYAYLKGMRIVMFQLSGFYYMLLECRLPVQRRSGDFVD